jgi:signal transduction histidine kinase
MKGMTAPTAKEREDTTAGQRTPVKATAAWLRQRVRLLDFVVTASVFLYNLPILPAYYLYFSDPRKLAALLAISATICGSYLLRRRYPLGVLAVMLVAAWIQLAVGEPIIPADFLLLLAVYNVATRFRWSMSLPSAAVVVLWLLVAIVPRLGGTFLGIGQLGLFIVLVVWVWTWGTLVRIRRDYIAGLQEHARYLERERETQVQIAAADERARIAREIHDIVSHGLSVVVVMSDGAASKVDDEPERAKSAMLIVRDTGRSALAEMRRMLGVLRDGEPGSRTPQPGICQLDRLVADSKVSGLPVTLTVEGGPVEVSASLDLAIYRLVQEALTNVRKHAGPAVNQVDVRLRYGAAELEVRITDDGHGPRATASAVRGGHGLAGMRERITAYRGTVRAGARRSGGFEVVAVLPTGDDS